jgi:hypothetical protein
VGALRVHLGGGGITADASLWLVDAVRRALEKNIKMRIYLIRTVNRSVKKDVHSFNKVKLDNKKVKPIFQFAST